MFITQRQELAIRLLYFFLPWPLSKLLPPNLGRLFFGPGGLPSSYFLDSLPYSIDTPGHDQEVPIYPDILPGEIPVSTETPTEPVLPVPSSGLPQPSGLQLPVITPDPISSTPRYESVPAKVIPTQYHTSRVESPIKPSTFVSSRGRGGSESVSIFMPLPGTPGKVSDIPFKQSLPKISPQKSLFSSSRGRGGSVSTSIFMPLPGRKLSPATVSIKQPLPYQAGDKSRQTTLIKSISYKNTTPRMQRLLSMSNRHVSINPTQGLSMQQSSFVSGHSYTNLVRAFKPQASFPFGHTGGARGGSYSVTYFVNLSNPFSLFSARFFPQSNQTAPVAGFDPANMSAHAVLTDGGCTLGTDLNNNYAYAFSLNTHSSGKYWVEFYLENSSYNHSAGIGNPANDPAIACGNFIDGWASDCYTKKETNNVIDTLHYYLNTPSYGGMAIDLDAGEINWYKDGVNLSTTYPANPAPPHFSGVSGPVALQFGTYSLIRLVKVNFSGTGLHFSPPPGFVAGW